MLPRVPVGGHVRPARVRCHQTRRRWPCPPTAGPGANRRPCGARASFTSRSVSPHPAHALAGHHRRRAEADAQIDHQARPQALAAQPGAGPAGHERQAVLVGVFDQRAEAVFVFGDGDGVRGDVERAGVGGVHRPVGVVGVQPPAELTAEVVTDLVVRREHGGIVRGMSCGYPAGVQSTHQPDVNGRVRGRLPPQPGGPRGARASSSRHGHRAAGVPRARASSTSARSSRRTTTSSPRSTRRCGRAARSSTCRRASNVEMPLQAYFRINAENMGQFERTLIIADEGRQVHYIEGCSAPVYTTDSLHSAVVEIVVKPSAPGSPTRPSRTGRTTSSTWSPSGPGSRPRATWSGSTATSAAASP